MPPDPTETNPFLRRLLDIYNSHQPSAFDALLTEECVLVRNGVEANGREEVKRVLAKLYRAFPDLEYGIDDAVGGGDKLVVRWHGRGTHRGDYLGVPPTGCAIFYTGITLMELSGDRVARLWVSADQLGLLRTMSVAAKAAASPEAHP